VIALARQFAHVTVYCFEVAGTARDPLPCYPNLAIVNLGSVTSGIQLLVKAPIIVSRVAASVGRGGWDVALLFETGLVSLTALIACTLWHRRSVGVIRGDSTRTAASADRLARGWRRLVAGLMATVHVVNHHVAYRSIQLVLDSPEVVDRARAKGADSPIFLPAGSITSQDVRHEVARPARGSRRRMRLVWVGRIERVKGLEVLLAALACARKTGRVISLGIIGAGPDSYVTELRGLAEVLGVATEVAFEGPIEHGPALLRRLRAADLFVLPSRSEGTPKVVIEALSQGLPVLATAVGGLPLILTRDCGRLVSPGDAHALCREIERFYDSPRDLRRLRAGAISRARDFTIDVLAARLAAAAADASSPRIRWRGGRKPRTIRN
jgi:glycosyltransferase involved in cell wall biosynthesis